MWAYKAEGDLAAFEVLVRRHQGRVFTYALRVLGQREAAEDLTQDTFIKVARYAERYRQGAPLKSWLMTIARNTCIDATRRRRLRRTASLDQAAPGMEAETEPWVERIPSEAAGPDEAAAASALAPALQRALQSLPEEQREVFVLREYSGVTFAEIAEITGASLGTVKSRMRYAMLALRARFEEEGLTKAALQGALPTPSQGAKP